MSPQQVHILEEKCTHNHAIFHFRDFMENMFGSWFLGLIMTMPLQDKDLSVLYTTICQY